jgi:transposase InsO family protein
MFELRQLGRQAPIRTVHERWFRLADALDLSSSARSRLAWFVWHDRHGKDVALTCRHFGIPRKSWYKWARRFDPMNLRLLEDRPRAPKNRRRRDITCQQVGRIVALRRERLRYGKEKIARIYAATYGETISSWKVQKVIEGSGLYYRPRKNARTQAKRRKAEGKKRISTLRLAKRTGFLFRADTAVRYWLNTKRFIFTAVDSTSKLAFAHMYTTHSSRNAADFLKRLHALTEGRIENVQTDNGSEFHGEFELALKDLGIPHYWSRVRTPKDNASCERFNRTLDDEFLRMGNMVTDPTEFNRRLTEWLVEYNFRRPHQTLGYMSPINFIYKHERLLPMYPSSTAP